MIDVLQEYCDKCIVYYVKIINNIFSFQVIIFFFIIEYSQYILFLYYYKLSLYKKIECRYL